MNGHRSFIGTQKIQAWPAHKNALSGYAVQNHGGCESWLPKEVFESTYLELADPTKITEDMVDAFIGRIEVHTFAPKTTVVKAILVNGYTIVESASCVDPINYDERLGTDICTKKIKDKVWELLGFLLQTAQNGIKRSK